ncbi:MAG: zf-HC2 domain-containing protein [Gemmatimonadetes bacterium]|nr:zf-HC2 domain-containing protein [Gemmatimonadota bacterium]
MTNGQNNGHLGAETLQALLEGELSERERIQTEEHLASCARCASELAAWSSLFDELGTLPTLAPHAGFRDRVLAEVSAPEVLPLAARIASVVGLGSRDRHPASDRLQDYVDGALPERQAARVRTHLNGCDVCAGEVAVWKSLEAKLGSLGRIAPAEDFAELVMARVQIPAPVPVRAPEWRRALAWAWSLLPRTRRAWAAICGVAVTPLTTIGLVLWTVFTHPALTPSALASFAWWKASGLLSAAWTALSRTALESESLFGLYSLLESVVRSPSALAAMFLFFSLGTVAAAWVLYRNLVPTRRVEGRYAHVSIQ